jgi:hypothetical protein
LAPFFVTICAIIHTHTIMNKIKKPEVDDWPDVVEATVNGIAIRIDYKNQQILLPEDAESRSDAIAAYLIDEELVVVETEERSVE